MGLLDLAAIERLYAAASDPVASLLVDAGAETEATIAYPGAPKTDAAWRMLDRFGRSQELFKYTRAMLSALRVLEALRGAGSGRGGGEADVRKANEMLRTGELFGASARGIVEAAEHGHLAA